MPNDPNNMNRRSALGRDIAMGGRSTLRGIGNVADLAVGEPLAQGMEAVGLGRQKRFTEMADMVADKMGLPTPSTDREVAMDGVGRTITGAAIPFGAATKIGTRAATSLASTAATTGLTYQAVKAQGDALDGANTDRVGSATLGGGSPGSRFRRRNENGGPARTTQAPNGTENTYNMDGGVNRVLQLPAGAREAAAAAEAMRGPERVATMDNNASNIQLRGRQGAIIRNPNAMSTVDRIKDLGTSLKGFPSLRKAAAEQIMAEDQAYEDNFQGAQRENATADMAQTQMQAQATEQFARRRLDADQFNVDSSEKRREQDTSAALDMAELRVKQDQFNQTQQAVAAKARSDRYAGLEKTFIDQGATPEQAQERALEMANDDGVNIGDVPALRGAETRGAARMESAINSRPEGWFGGMRANLFNRMKGLDPKGTDVSTGNFDRSNFNQEEQGFWQNRVDNAYNVVDNMLPGKQARMDDMVIAVDKTTGKRVSVPRSAMGGQESSEFRRQRLERMEANNQR